MKELARLIKRESRSLRVIVNADSVTVVPVFQQRFDVRTWQEWETAKSEGRCAFPDQECPAYGQF